jgi:Xaa-Pro aminopeptidase
VGAYDGRDAHGDEDQKLATLLSQAGGRFGIADARDVIRGVAAAPPGFERDGWMTLIGEGFSPQARDELRSLLEERRRRISPVPGDRGERLAALRTELHRRRLFGLIVPRSDEHQGEYVAPYAERLAWLTGFTGSAGTAVVLSGRAALFVDGRYTTQAAEEVCRDVFTVRHVTHEPIGEWLSQELPAKARLGYDPWLHTPNQVAAFERACAKAGAKAVPVEGNPVDCVWADKPPPPIAPVVPYDEAFAGLTAAEKCGRIAEVLRTDRQDAAFLAQTDSIAWLLNIRGGDVPFTPLVLAFALIHSNGLTELFVDPRKLTDGARAHLGDGVVVRSPGALAAALDHLGGAGKTVRIDPDGAPAWVAHRLRKAGAIISDGADPCQLPKATKTAAELSGVRAAHVRDGAALTRFLAWLGSAAEDGTVSESEAATRLEAFRTDNRHYRGPSFPTISAAGPHGAIVHYRVSPASDRALDKGSLYLVDSGAQYLDGTTDVTRTVAIGECSHETQQRFTLVLKGHITLATTCFPRGTTGSQLDTLARVALWQAGLDYDHGTGHGVGCYLGVHEGPQRISKLHNRVALQPGMILSNEPGFYKPGDYGIRIENLVIVRHVEAPGGAEHELLGLETVTLAPIDRRLIIREMLDAKEIAWLDGYHARVRYTLSPRLDGTTRRWLEDATRPI